MVVLNVNDVLESHVASDIQCLDRIYLRDVSPDLLAQMIRPLRHSRMPANYRVRSKRKASKARLSDLWKRPATSHGCAVEMQTARIAHMITTNSFGCPSTRSLENSIDDYSRLITPSADSGQHADTIRKAE